MLCQCNSTELKPTYTLSGSGNSLRIIFTTHEGITRRCPFPKKLWVQLVNHRYAANLLYYITSHNSANLLTISNSTASPLTVCIVTKVVYRTSLSKQATLNCFNLVIQLMLDSSNHSYTVSIYLQQKHSTALGIEVRLVQEHPSLSVKLT